MPHDSLIATVAPSGLGRIGDLPWGTHLCHFYSSAADLRETLVPYFRAGLLANERCLWITAEPLEEAAARAALAAAVGDLTPFERRGQLEILGHRDWYLRQGELAAEQVVEGWLAREAAALRRGFSGLRISGNTSFVQRPGWEGFVAYEALVHRAFAGRRILAVCSYDLDRCASEDLLDVLAHHATALVRRPQGWEMVSSATLLLHDVGSGVRGTTSHCEHVVHFFDEDFEAAGVAGFLGEGLGAGEAAVVIATPAHAAAIEQALRQAGIDAAAARYRGQLALIDAHEMLGKLCVDGEPRVELLRLHIGSLLAALAEQFGRVHAFGEMVDVLAADGKAAAAIALEGCWNTVLAEHRARLLCGYRIDAFDADPEAFRGVCESHSQVRWRGRQREAAALDPDRLVAELEQKSRLARQALEQLGHLQRLTSALSEANLRADVVRIVEEDIRRALDAEQALLAVATGDAGELVRLGSYAAAAPKPLALDASNPLADSFRSGRPQWLVGGGRLDVLDAFPLGALAVLPLQLGKRRLGVLALGYRRERELSPARRALLQDVARQVAIALDRATTHEEGARARRAAEEASRTKDEFLAMLGHELRNPLAPIVTALQLMRLRGSDQLERERTIIERQVDHMRRLVDDLLDVSRITSGKVQLERRPIELAEVVARALELAGPLIEQRDHRLELDVPSRGLQVEGDPARLAQVVSNVITNAAKYTPSGGRIEVRARSAGPWRVLSVRDNGMGIAPELMPAIFDSFVQAPRSRDRSEGGLGLGLAIARSLVGLHGGSIEASSEGPGKGAELTIRLPAVKPGDEPGAIGGASFDSLQSALRVLVVDDNVDAAETLGELLELMGCQVRLANDGPAALLAALDARPDLVLLDIGLPVMDGYEVAARLRSHPELAATRVVALTGYCQPEDRERSRRNGFAEHLVKPLTPERLRSLIASFAGD